MPTLFVFVFPSGVVNVLGQAALLFFFLSGVCNNLEECPGSHMQTASCADGSGLSRCCIVEEPFYIGIRLKSPLTDMHPLTLLQWESLLHTPPSKSLTQVYASASSTTFWLQVAAPPHTDNGTKSLGGYNEEWIASSLSRTVFAALESGQDSSSQQVLSVWQGGSDVVFDLSGAPPPPLRVGESTQGGETLSLFS